MTLAIVTATTNPARAVPCLASWDEHARGTVTTHILVNGRAWFTDDAEATGLQASWQVVPDYLGTVPAFQRAVAWVLEHTDADLIACLHDDFRIDEDGWDEKVLRHFERHPACGLAGFGGALGLGSPRLYREPYDPMQLARAHFRSNLVDAEAHGIRSLLPEKVACLDGFSQIGRRAFWQGFTARQARLKPHLDQLARDLAGEHPHGFLGEGSQAAETTRDPSNRPWTVLADLGFVHHFYDGALGCLAARYGWETWYLPLRGQHYGGQTAVGDAGYGDWAKTQHDKGDRGFWEDAHRIGYEAFRDVLPLYPRS